MARNRVSRSIFLNFRTGGLLAIIIGVFLVVLNFISFIKVPFLKNPALHWVASLILSLLVIQLVGLLLRSKLAARCLRPFLAKSPMCERIFKSVLGSNYLLPTVRVPPNLEDAGAKTVELQDVVRTAIEEFLTYSRFVQEKNVAETERSRWVDSFLAELRRKVDRIVPPLSESNLDTGAKEALVPIGNAGVCMAGIVVRFVTYSRPISGGGTERVDLAIVFTPTVPMPFTGYMLYVPKEALWYTGRTAQECCLTAMSLGMN